MARLWAGRAFPLPPPPCLWAVPGDRKSVCSEGRFPTSWGCSRELADAGAWGQGREGPEIICSSFRGWFAF